MGLRSSLLCKGRHGLHNVAKLTSFFPRRRKAGAIVEDDRAILDEGADPHQQDDFVNCPPASGQDSDEVDLVIWDESTAGAAINSDDAHGGSSTLHEGHASANEGSQNIPPLIPTPIHDFLMERAAEDHEAAVTALQERHDTVVQRMQKKLDAAAARTKYLQKRVKKDAVAAKELQAEHARLLPELESAKDATSSKDEENAQLRQEVERVRRDNAAWAWRDVNATAQLANLTTEVKETHERFHREMRESLADVLQQISRVEAGWTQAEEGRRAADDARNVSEEFEQVAREQANSLEQRNADLEEELRRVITERGYFKAAVERLEETARGLDAQVGDAVKERDALASDKAMLALRLMDQTASAQDRAQENAALEKRHSGLLQSVANGHSGDDLLLAMAQHIDAMSTDHQGLLSRLERAEAKVAAAEQEKADQAIWRAVLEDRDVEHEAAAQQFDIDKQALDVEIFRLECGHDNDVEEMDGLRSALETAEQRIAELDHEVREHQTTQMQLLVDRSSDPAHLQAFIVRLTEKIRSTLDEVEQAKAGQEAEEDRRAKAEDDYFWCSEGYEAQERTIANLRGQIALMALSYDRIRELERELQALKAEQRQTGDGAVVECRRSGQRR
ncbi:MAG: hypothetical protein M1838_005711 [Thelocarpon superellum]|nr:MAG: hypothetical protein M1838_005711 [Thelocarpon superellum]